MRDSAMCPRSSMRRRRTLAASSHAACLVRARVRVRVGVRTRARLGVVIRGWVRIRYEANLFGRPESSDSKRRTISKRPQRRRLDAELEGMVRCAGRAAQADADDVALDEWHPRRLTVEQRDRPTRRWASIESNSIDPRPLQTPAQTGEGTTCSIFAVKGRLQEERCFRCRFAA